MESDETVDAQTMFPTDGSAMGPEVLPALAVIWSLSAPQRVGELFLLSPGRREPQILGRGGPRPGQGSAKLGLFRQRPGSLIPTGPLNVPQISREQLRLRANQRHEIEMEVVGRCPTFINGAPTQGRATLQLGDVLELKSQLLLLVIERPSALGPAHGQPTFAFGGPDAQGIVGESAAAWDLRSQLNFVAKQDTHTLILGESGTGKELAARVVHEKSSRRRAPMMSRNAAVMPEGLVDAELFGTERNYPNPGVPERPGLIGDAHGGTLFLDEIGELPSKLQAHLLRVMDLGEYQRLGSTKLLRSDFRLIAATNRAVDELKHDIAARFKLRLRLPSLNDRREDIPLLAAHLVDAMTRDNPELRRRLFQELGSARVPRFTPRLMTALVRHTFKTHIRELEQLLWQSLQGGLMLEYLDLTPQLEASLALPEATQPRRGPVGKETLEGLIHKHFGKKAPVARELGISRAELEALVQSHGIEVERRVDTITRAQLLEAMAQAGGVKSKAWQLLELPSRRSLQRLLEKFEVKDGEW